MRVGRLARMEGIMCTTLCEIPLDVYRRLRLLYLIERFTKACYGSARLQKVAFFSESGQELRLFTFRRAPYGPYSQELQETLEQLLSMGLVTALPTPKEGNGYLAAHAPTKDCAHAEWLRAISVEAVQSIDRAVRDYGYLKHDEVIQAGHIIEGFAEAAPYEVLQAANADDFVQVPLSADECQDLVLSLSPGFVQTAVGIANAADSFDFDQVPAA